MVPSCRRAKCLANHGDMQRNPLPLSSLPNLWPLPCQDTDTIQIGLNQTLQHHFDYSLSDRAQLPYVFRDSFIHRASASCFLSHLAHERAKCILRVDGSLFTIWVRVIRLVRENETASHWCSGGCPPTYGVHVCPYTFQCFRKGLLGHAFVLSSRLPIFPWASRRGDRYRQLSRFW